MNSIPQSTLDAFNKFTNANEIYGAGLIFLLELEIMSKEGNSDVNRIYEEFDEKAKGVDLNVREYFRCSTFYSLVSSMELFFQEIIKSVVRIHPKKIGTTTFKLSEILDYGSEDEIINKAIDDYLNKIMYKKPIEYLEEICDLLSIKKNKLQQFWPTFVEAKARRDIGIHNDWICNDIYLRKIKEAGIQSEIVVGDRIMPVNKDYINSVRDSMMSIASEISLSVAHEFKNK